MTHVEIPFRLVSSFEGVGLCVDADDALVYIPAVWGEKSAWQAGRVSALDMTAA